MEDDESHVISDMKIEEIKEAFNLFDVNGDGLISVNEIGDIFRSIGQNPSQKQLEEMVNEVRENKDDNQITFDHFLKLILKRNKDVDTEEELIEAFKIFDTEGNGLINVETLKQAMLSYGEKLSPEELENIINEADEDQDGFINYEEFIKNVLNY